MHLHNTNLHAVVVYGVLDGDTAVQGLHLGPRSKSRKLSSYESLPSGVVVIDPPKKVTRKSKKSASIQSNEGGSQS